jgi:hypothetical protein
MMPVRVPTPTLEHCVHANVHICKYVKQDKLCREDTHRQTPIQTQGSQDTTFTQQYITSTQ